MKTDVLDKGYVRLVDYMGDDLTIVNTARTSFAKESQELTLADEKLINFLIKNKHDSCMRHNVFTFEVHAPLMVVRQWYKHAVAASSWDDQNGWNENSRRYITEDEEFYVPEHFFAAPENKKQGAGGEVDQDTNAIFRRQLMLHQIEGERLYTEAMQAGVAAEQARLFLPAYGLYVTFRWTASLNAVMNFFALRLDPHAQLEIRQYAEAMKPMVQSIVPVAYQAFMESRVSEPHSNRL